MHALAFMTNTTFIRNNYPKQPSIKMSILHNHSFCNVRRKWGVTSSMLFVVFGVCFVNWSHVPSKYYNDICDCRRSFV